MSDWTKATQAAWEENNPASPPADQPADHIGEEALSRCKAFAAWFFGDEAGPAPESVTPLDLRVLLSLIARQQETIRADGEARKQGVGIGMVIAAALVADDDPTKAEEILQAVNMTTAAKMRAKGVDEYDIGKLKTVISDIASRERNQARARLSARQGGGS